MKNIVCAAAALTATAVPAAADQLKYEPRNPAFGGDSFNADYLFRSAEIQNQYRPGTASRSEDSLADSFARSLQSRLLSGLANDVVDAIFGDNPQESGRIVFGEQEITFVRGLETVSVTIFNNATGETTTIEVPILAVEGGAP